MAQRTLRAAKNMVRKEIKLSLKLMSEAEKLRQSQIVTKKLLELDLYKESKSLSTYLHMPSELYTHEVLSNIFKSGKKCYIPHYIGDEMSMVYLKDQADYDALPLTSWNIKQPQDNEQRERAIDGEGLDIIIVPGLGFTKGGDRLGRGKGYYDKYFERYKKAFNKLPVMIGLAYTCQIKDMIPVDEHDMPLDYVLYAD